MLYFPDKAELCVGFSNGEYAYKLCLPLLDIAMLLGKVGLWEEE